MSDERIFDDPEVIERLYWDEELSIREIADRHNCSHRTVLNRMKEYGIDRRSRGEAQWKEPSRSITPDGYVLVTCQRTANGTSISNIGRP